MNEVAYEAATWGSDWEEAEQGSTVAIASFDNANGAQINVPYGMLLGERGCIVQQSETADFLFGISRKCDYIALSAENQEAQKLYSCDSYSIELRFRLIWGPKKPSETVFRNKAIVAICFSSAVALDEALFKLHKVQSSFCFAAVGMQVSSWRYRTMVTPGLSDLAQVTGGYDLLPKEKVFLDLRESRSRVTAGDMALLAPVGWRFR